MLFSNYSNVPQLTILCSQACFSNFVFIESVQHVFKKLITKFPYTIYLKTVISIEVVLYWSKHLIVKHQVAN